MNISDIEMTPLIAFFSLFGIFSSGYIISFITSGLLVYKPLIDYEDDEDDEEEYKIVINNNFNKLKSIKLNDDKIKEFKTKFSREKTAEGEIIICYNDDTESFNYWSEKKNVYFKTLEILTKKYVTDFDCKILFKCITDVDTDVESVKLKSNENKSVFANLKNYNKVSSKKDNIVKNRYSYRGNISDWESLKTINTKENIKVDNISFKEFKQQQKDI